MAIRANLVMLALLTGMIFGQGSVQEIPRSSAPVPTLMAQPNYTDHARKLKIEGAVLLQVEINEKPPRNPWTRLVSIRNQQVAGSIPAGGSIFS
jgi:hypothetical protein